MPTTDTTRRLRPQVITRDIKSLSGLETIADYSTTRLEALPENLRQLYTKMLEHRDQEAKTLTIHREAADAAREAEWAFHNAILAMRDVVRGQYGSDSSQAQAVGLKKKSERKRPKPKQPSSTAEG